MQNDLTVVIVAKDEEANLRKLLPSLKWAERLLIIDNGSNDGTVALAQELGVALVTTKAESFSKIREVALDKVQTKWLFYLDADERVPQALKDELIRTLRDWQADLGALAMRRRNFCYGRELKHGGWEKDWVIRLFLREALKGWQGKIHESPKFVGGVKKLSSPLLHLTHRNTEANLRKSSAWTIKEARLLAADPSTPPVTKKMIWRKIVMEFYRRYFRDQGRKDGLPGLIESLTQAWNRGFVYIQVWELQQRPSLAERYDRIEEQVDKI